MLLAICMVFTLIPNLLAKAEDTEQVAVQEQIDTEAETPVVQEEVATEQPEVAGVSQPETGVTEQPTAEPS